MTNNVFNCKIITKEVWSLGDEQGGTVAPRLVSRRRVTPAGGSGFGEMPSAVAWLDALQLHARNTPLAQAASGGGSGPCLYSEVNCNGTIVEVETCCGSMPPQDCVRQHAYDVEHACDE